MGGRWSRALHRTKLPRVGTIQKSENGLRGTTSLCAVRRQGGEASHSEWKRPCVALYTIEKLAKRLPRISSSKPLLPSSLSPPSSPKAKGKGGGPGDLVSPVWRGAEASSAYSLTSEQSQSTFRALAPV